MQHFYITPFSLSVLNVAIMLTLMNVFLWRIPGKLPATQQLLTFLIGVDIVFLAFFYIFSSLDLSIVKIAWWILHSVVFFILFLILFAYHYPRLYFKQESKNIFIGFLLISITTYIYYIYHTTQIDPIFDPSASMFIYLGTHEIGILVGLELLWIMAIFTRQIKILKQPENLNDPQNANQALAIRKIILLLFSPVIFLVLIVFAYLELASWEIISHLLGTGMMIFVLLFIVVYLNNALEPSSLQIKMIGLSLGAILVVLGFSTAITMNLHKKSFLSLKQIEIEGSRSDISAGHFNNLPKEMSYVALGNEIVHRGSDFTNAFSGETKNWEGTWLFRKMTSLDPNTYFISHKITITGQEYEIGYRYQLFRAHSHQMATQLLYIMFGAVIFVVIAFPLFFNRSLFKPLRELLGGVDSMEKGILDVDLAVGVRDEIGVLTQSFNTMVSSVRESRAQLHTAYEKQIDLTDAYSRFVPKEILTTLNKKNILELKLGDNVQQEMTVMFSDIRSFTTISESMSPEQIFRFINNYLEQVGPFVRKHNGYIDKYIGDAVMALFPGGPDDALAAAIDMHKQVRELNSEGAETNSEHVEIRIGIGIHTGELMLGTIGEHQRMEGTVISDAVNLAARIEGLTKAYNAPILISNNSYSKLAQPENFTIRRLDRVKVKGKSEWVDIIEVLDGEEDSQRILKLSNRAEFNNAVSLFQKRRFVEALELFNILKEQNSQDVSVVIYIERCQQFIEQGIPENWDGSFTYMNK